MKILINTIIVMFATTAFANVNKLNCKSYPYPDKIITAHFTENGKVTVTMTTMKDGPMSESINFEGEINLFNINSNDSLVVNIMTDGGQGTLSAIKESKTDEPYEGKLIMPDDNGAQTSMRCKIDWH